MNIKNSVLDYIGYKQLNWYGHVQRMDKEMLPRRRRRRRRRRRKMMSSWKKGETSKFVDARVATEMRER